MPAQNSLIPRRDLFGNPERTMVRLSPDQKLISWVAPRDGVLNVFVAPLDRPSDARPVTNDRKRGIRFYGWAVDGSRILFIQDVGGDEDWHIHAVDPGVGGEAVDLTPYQKTTAHWLGQSVDRPGLLAVGLNDRDAAWHDVYLVELSTGKRELMFLNDGGYGGKTLDHQLRLRMLEKPNPGGGRTIFRTDGKTHTPWLVVGHEDDLTTSVEGITRDGNTLYVTSSVGRDKSALLSVDCTNGNETLIFAHPKSDIGSALVNPVTKVVEAVGSHYLSPEWHLIGDALKADFAVLEKSLGPQFAVVDRPRADSKWIVTANDPQQPGRYHLYDRNSGTVTFLFEGRPELAKAKLAKMHPVAIRARDGLELVSFLSLPAGERGERPKAPLPMVLTVHGGPWGQDSYGYDPEHQWLADRGYAVLSVNFRGSTGYGKSFINAGDNEWAGRMHDDLVDAVEWAIAERIADRGKVAIMGGSYGGYATLVGLTFTPELFACGVDIVGPSNLETLLATVPPYWAAFFENLARRVGDPRTEPGRQQLKDRSPLHRADKISRPLLIGQGANDPRVKQAEADQIVGAMRANGLPVVYALYPDEGHGFAEPANRISFYALAEVFLAGVIGGRCEPIGHDLAGSSLQVPTGREHIAGLSAALAGS